ncbi:MAG: sn-glycerol-3-phosphate ABC transporter substrate-binding protein UgpB [Armatimonadota bacterium]|nr:sn-glycerol-3-phosphate ABC transporter substrate-binding protein UgpB [Armatimonadota bacterium]MDR7452252.1 sn-glycerol-3-phosphate ABC transporter substrate-binding protein UgpB [Armatimonadota bacterium]MDR7466653.1 sn-glycerol-3-phosphate ABC transporter substrate-binding protein UgpB [Armatimonadota bacterium]MDR7492873.1 sn-glycerol-3-phosphate ABC transporter substrate-binding protein UgpB [Armatimonadota bacterium]MDR7498649.1 sn-glycerol-3-phosphate ABC transporter substrate-bindin
MPRPTVLTLLALLAASALLAAGPAPGQAQARIDIDFWHAMRGPLGETLERMVAGFNASQTRYQVKATFKGSYPETMVAAIAAFRAGNAPHVVQMFEVGTATMMAAGAAIKPVWQLMKETGTPFDPATYLPAVRGYYSSADGKMVAFPFNSSTPILWYNKDAFRKAGLDPEKPPATWPELRAAAQRIRAANAAPCGFSTAWPTWTQFENFGAMHDIPFATRANGFEGFDAELLINAPLYVRHLQFLMEMQQEGTFKYGGRDAAGDSLFPSGECALLTGSSALYGRVAREAKFAWGVGYFPHYPDVKGAPKNSVIGGAAFWVMTAPRRTVEEYRGVAEFFRYLGSAEVAGKWHMETGYVPISFTGAQYARATGYYQREPWAELPIRQLTRTLPTKNSKGFRLGNMPEIRVIVYEEIERAFQGQQTAKQALDNAVRRGNVVLRRFQQTVGQ